VPSLVYFILLVHFPFHSVGLLVLLPVDLASKMGMLATVEADETFVCLHCKNKDVVAQPQYTQSTCRYIFFNL